MIIGDIETTEKAEYEDLLKNYYDKMEIIEEQELIVEIERLNNIINELEKYINEEYIYDELGMKIFDASELQDKLQELKGEILGDDK